MESHAGIGPAMLVLNIGLGGEVPLSEIDTALAELQGGAPHRWLGILASRLTLSDVLERNVDQAHDHESRAYCRWREPLRLLELAVAAATRFGVEFRKEVEGTLSDDCSQSYSVLTKLHQRGCLTAAEMVCLLRNGYPDGALSRWRLLLELWIVAQFVVERGERAARSYQSHGAEQAKRFIDGWQRYADELNHPKFTKQEVTAVRERKRHHETVDGGSPSDLGWAISFLSSANPTIHDLAAEVGLGHFRPYYDASCNAIHATSRALDWSLGESRDGASTTGINIPAKLLLKPLEGLLLSLHAFRTTAVGRVTLGAISCLMHEVATATLRAEAPSAG